MAVSQVNIINNALIRLGANTISSLDEGSIESTLANEVWESSRQNVLRSHPWNFAIKEQELAQIYGVSSHRFQYAYQLPSDFLRLLQVYDQNEFRLQGRVIYSNSEKCVVKYVFDEIDPSVWDSAFTDVLAARLAFELAYPITKSTSLMDSLGKYFAQKLQNAKYIDASEDISDPIAPYDSPFISARYYG